MKNIVIAVIGFTLITMIGTCVYFVAGVSATFPPIKQYSYNQSFAQLKTDLDSLVSANKEVLYTITDTTGDKERGHNYYLDIKLINSSDTVMYNVVYESTDFFFKKNFTEIGIVGAFDIAHDKGGYGYGDGTNGVKELVFKFENQVLHKLYKGQPILVVAPN